MPPRSTSLSAGGPRAAKAGASRPARAAAVGLPPRERFPDEFEDILTPRGRHLLGGSDPLCGALADPRTRFVVAHDLVDERKATRLRGLLDRHLLAALETIDRPIPPESIWEMTEDYAETLPKAARVGTIYFDSARERGARVARETGLTTMLRSASFTAFATALAGRALAPGHGIQALCYRAGDYSGPHNAHHPENPRARGGYLDVHLSLASPMVAHQWLVYARAGHFTEIAQVAGGDCGAGTITAYRLPFWHQVTPLVARRGCEAGARRWVLLGTFLY
ncbi:MAG: hypothetical protein JNL07_04245, partial [Rhodospirillales bacterium]|nr:hypothetical protein [Rhodospirillales bacterium]